MTKTVDTLAGIDPAMIKDLMSLLADSKRGRKAKGKGRAKPTPEESKARIAANDAECIRVFKAAGYKTVEPRFNVLTFKKWLEKGRRVKPGERSHKVGPFSLFHEEQTEPLASAVDGSKAKSAEVNVFLGVKPEPKARPEVAASSGETANWQDWNK